jgi:hypothetical protein
MNVISGNEGYSPTTNQQVKGNGEIWAGFGTTGTIPEDFMPRGMSNLGQMSYITRGTARFMNMLHTRFPNPVHKDTREHRVHELSELDRTFTVTRASNDSYFAATRTTTQNKFSISKAQGALVQPNDILILPGIYSKWDSATTKVVYSKIFSAEFSEGDQMIVLNVEDRTDVDEAVITVRRAYHGTGRKDYTGTIVPTPVMGSTVAYDVGADDFVIPVGETVLKSLPTHPEGGDAPRGFYKNPVIDNNFTQEYKFALEWTKESEIEKHLIGKTPIEIHRLLKSKHVTLLQERHALFSRKGKQMDSVGRVMYTTGGLIEFIPKDIDHFHTYTAPQLSYPNLLRLLEGIEKDGGAGERDMFCGIRLFNALKIAFYESGLIRINQEATKRFNIVVEQIVGSGVSLNIIPLFTLEENGWGNKALVLDFTRPSFVPVTHPDWDMKVESDIAPKGVQIQKEQWISISGYERRYAQYQHILSFPSI